MGQFSTYRDNTFLQQVLNIDNELNSGKQDEAGTLYRYIQDGNTAKVEEMIQMNPRLCQEKRDISSLEKREGILHEQKQLLIFGELPLTMATLTFSTAMVDILLQHNADMFATNSTGDTVFHSAVKYAGFYNDKIPQIIEIITHLVTRLKENGKTTENDGWMKTPFHTRNKDGYTVLQLSVAYELHEIFNFLSNIEGIYCKYPTTSTELATKYYDITELDTLSNFRKFMKDELASDLISRFKNIKNLCKDNIEYKAYIPAISELLFKQGLSSSVSTALVDSEPLKSLISRKWGVYKTGFFIWMFFFFSYLLLVTGFCILRRDIYFRNNEVKSLSEMENDLPGNKLLLVFFFFSSFIGVTPVLILIYSRHFVKQISFSYVFHNIDTIILYSLFIIFIFFDTCGFLSDTRYNGFFLTLALPCGWAFGVLIFRAADRFAYFTVLIRKVIIGDLLSFMAVMAVIFIAFSVCIHDLMKYKTDPKTNEVTDDDDFNTIWGSMYSLFFVYLGIKDVTNLSEARIYELAYPLYTIFIIVSHILLLNALLAVMSNTCSRIYYSRKALGLKQKLSIMILMEEMFALHLFCSSVGSRCTNESDDFFDGRNYLPLRMEKHLRRTPLSNIEKKLVDLQQIVELLQNIQNKSNN